MSRWILALPAAALVFLAANIEPAVAQQTDSGPVYQPIDQRMPPGMAGQWSAVAGRFTLPQSQPVRVELPSTGIVTFFGDAPLRSGSAEVPAQVGLWGGYLYRFEIRDMPEFPGVSVYPTIELVDRLHPPIGKAGEFPIQIAFTEEEIDKALAGQLITKVVYLEQPQLALAGELDTATRVLEVEAHRNLLTEADLLGRPLLLVRLGDRVPNGPHDLAFFGAGAPLTWPVPAKDAKADPPVGCAYSNASALVRQFPDEYIWDGGDREHPVHYGEFNRHGLNTEDTISEYVDHRGKFHVTPSNRVAIYAPRFGAARTISAPLLHFTAERPGGTLEIARISDVRDRMPAVHQQKNERVDGVRVRLRASGLDVEAGPSTTNQVQILAGHIKLINVFQNLNFVRTGEFIHPEEARLAYGIQAAFTWTRDQYPVIAASLAGMQEVYVAARADELAGTVDMRKPGRLRLVKLADRKVAQSGDIVNFTIRYDNLGDLPVHDVRILDNLTPRLEYIEDSATADRAGRLIIGDNEEGSLILTWEFFEPLEGKTGGVVAFKARVR